MTNDRETRAMSRLLTRGGKMLQEACEDCGSPLFRHDGEVVCAVCEERSEGSPSEATDQEEPDEEQESVEEDGEEESRDDWRDRAEQELGELAVRLASEANDEDDLSRLEQRLDALERTTEIIESVESLDV